MSDGNGCPDPGSRPAPPDKAPQPMASEITKLEQAVRVLIDDASPAMIANKGYGAITTATLPHERRKATSG